MKKYICLDCNKKFTNEFIKTKKIYDELFSFTNSIIVIDGIYSNTNLNQNGKIETAINKISGCYSILANFLANLFSHQRVHHCSMNSNKDGL